MRQVVIYLKPTRSELVQQTTFAISGLRHEFEVIRLWEVPVAELQLAPGLLPLAILSQTTDKSQTLQQIADQIAQLPDQIERNNIAAATFILAGLVLEKAMIQQIWREDIVKESVTYQDILQQGLQQGRQQGRQEESRSLILKLLKRRLGTLPSEITTEVERLSVEQLEALGEALLDFTQVNELVNWLDQNA